MAWLPNMSTSGGYPMHRFSENDDDLKRLCLYLDRGQNPNQEVLGSNTLLHVAVQSYRTNDRVVQKLIDAGADIELTTSMGYTPLQFAVISRNREAVRKLIEAGVQINIRNNFGRTALHYAIYSFQPRSSLIRYTWMHVLRSTPDAGILKILLEHADTDVNPLDSHGETPLMWAVKYGSVSAVKLLLRRGANPNILNRQGQNSLHVALSVENRRKGIITELLRNGSGIYDIDSCGQSPVDILFHNDVNNFTLNFALDCLQIIAIKYHVRRDLKYKLRRIPQCTDYLRKARREVKLMRKKIICDKINFHDFASGCFQERDKKDHTLQIYRQVALFISSRKCKIYFDVLFYRIPLPVHCSFLNAESPEYKTQCGLLEQVHKDLRIERCLN